MTTVGVRVGSRVRRGDRVASTLAVKVRAPRWVCAGLAIFVGVSAVNVMPPVAQLLVYVVALAALGRPPHRWPLPEFVLALGATLFAAVIALASGGEIGGALRYFRPVLEGFLLAQVLYKWCCIRSFHSLIQALGVFLAIQLVLALAMAVDPVGRAAFIESVYADDGYQNSQFTAALLFRGYGFTRHHLYGFPLACGLVCAWLLVCASVTPAGLYRKVLSLLCFGGVLMVVMNARVGLVPIVATYLLGSTLLFNKFFPRQFVVVALALAVPVVYLATALVGDDLEQMFTWLGAGVEQFYSDDQPDSTTISDLSQMWVVSSNPLELLVGTGAPCGTDDACYSDIGIVRAVQEGGVLVLALVLTLYARILRHLRAFFAASLIGVRGRRKRRTLQLFDAVIYLTFLAAIFKGEAYGPSDYSRLLVAIAFLGWLAAAPVRKRPARRQAASLGAGLATSSQGRLPRLTDLGPAASP